MVKYVTRKMMGKREHLSAVVPGPQEARKKRQKGKCATRHRSNRMSDRVVARIDSDSIDILHLSDLHLLGENLSDRYDLLLNDISDQTSGLKNIVIVVTGDIASYGKVKDSEGSILAFFTKLKGAIKAKVLDVELVPGNHDIDRNFLVLSQSWGWNLSDFSSLIFSSRRIGATMWSHNDNYRTLSA